MTLLRNMVYEWIDKPANPPAVERVLWLDSSVPYVWVINIYDRKARPVRRMVTELEAAFETGEARVLERDPFDYLVQPEEALKLSHRQRRDRSWAIIQPLFDSGDPEIFHFYARNSPITKLAKAKGYRKATVYHLVRRFLQRGQIINAVLPLYDNCGWRDRSESRKPRTTKSKTKPKKLGRPSKLSLAREESLGVNVTKEMSDLFRAGIRLFYEKRLRQPLKRAYDLTLEQFFNCGYARNRNGVWVPQLPPASELPTYHQFKYWYKKDRSPRHAQISRVGEIRHNLSGRAKLGNSTLMAAGPGSVFQVDAAIGDVSLVSSLNRLWLIGRPVIYFIIDVFSRLVVGLSVSLEGPSWLGAMLALENAATDKVAYCAEYGIAIEQSQWPAVHLPEVLMADRGEFEGYSADHLVKAFGTRVDNTPPYRADLKGIVEQHIDLSNEKTIHWVPGRVRKRERGDRDHRLDAKLTLWEFQKIMILSTLHHIQNRRIDDYPMDADMIAAGVEPYPIDLWNWGIKNRSGHLRKFDIDRVRLNLLPEEEASVTQKGIYFSNLYYSCELARKEQWFERAGEKGSWKIRVAHDPRTRSRIYLRLDNGKRMEACHLLDKHKAFLDRHWYETLDEFELRAQRKESAQTRHKRSDADLHAATDEVVSGAETDFEEIKSNLSNRARITGIRGHRKAERDMQRAADKWELGPDPPKPKPSAPAPVAGYVPPPQPTDKLRQARERIIRNGQRSK